MIGQGKPWTRSIAVAVLAFAMVGFARPSQAQDYPVRPITLVVPFAAGGGNDVIARLVAEKMSRTLGQQIIIDNKGGAGGSVGTRQVAKSPPDGYTLGLGGTGTLAIAPSLYPNAGYNPRKDFAPIGLIATGGMVVLVHPAVPIHSISELIAFAKKNPKQLNYASAGAGSGIHLAAVLFASLAGVELTHIPYKGTGPALNDLIGGHVGLYFSSLAPAISQVKDNKVRALAVTAGKRSAQFPDLPTVIEAGLPGYEAVLRYGIVAPAGTPRPIVDKLAAAMKQVAQNADVQRRFQIAGARCLASTPEEAAAHGAKERPMWREMVKVSGAKAE